MMIHVENQLKQSNQIQYHKAEVKFCDYSDIHIFLKQKVTAVEQRADPVAIAADRHNMQVVFDT